MAKKFYITTAIDYTNGAPHIGHAYEKVLADVIARYHRLKGEEVFFLTGVDQHGQKVQQSAAKEGVAPQEFVDRVTAQFRGLWQKLEVKYDGWAATTEKLHQRVVRGILQRLFDAGQIYKDRQAGHYSVRQEQFLTDKERGADGEFGAEWGTVEYREEENYYFKLSAHKAWLIEFIRTHAGFVAPSYRQTELLNAIEKLNGDLCISRPKARLDWGIELPFDANFVTYVWFDALTNYISFAGYDPTRAYAEQPDEFLERWPPLQIIGKDILIPAHGIYWMIMLHAIGFPDEAMPRFLVHGWWNSRGAKMSKSLGNTVDPEALADTYGAEAVRYYLLSDIAVGRDADFDQERLAFHRFNTDLANTLGNLVNRTLSMAEKYRAGKLRADPSAARAEQLKSKALSTETCLEYRRFADDSLWDEALAVAMGLARTCNLQIEEAAPWKLAKDPGAAADLDAVLYHLAESLRIIALLISPVLPKAAHGILDQLNWKLEQSGEEKRFSLGDADWGKLPDGHVVGKPTPLFPRIEIAKA